MKSRLLCLLLFITMTTVPFAVTAAGNDFTGRCDIVFIVRTTVKNFTGTAPCEPFEGDVVDTMLSVPAIVVEVAAMDTGNARRDKDMRAMLEHEKFPQVTGVSEPFPVSEIITSEPGLIRVPEELTFDLTIRDITRRITAGVIDPQLDTTTMTATLVFDISLSSFDLNPPSFLGIIRVKDIIEVNATMSLELNPASTFTLPTLE